MVRVWSYGGGAGTHDPKKVLGVTKLDVVRAKAFIGQITGTDPREVDIPVVGGHAGVTILPLLSQVPLLVVTPPPPLPPRGQMSNARPSRLVFLWPPRAGARGRGPTTHPDTNMLRPQLIDEMRCNLLFERRGTEVQILTC